MNCLKLTFLVPVTISLMGLHLNVPLELDIPVFYLAILFSVWTVLFWQPSKVPLPVGLVTAVMLNPG